MCAKSHVMVRTTAWNISVMAAHFSSIEFLVDNPCIVAIIILFCSSVMPAATFTYRIITASNPRHTRERHGKAMHCPSARVQTSCTCISCSLSTCPLTVSNSLQAAWNAVSSTPRVFSSSAIAFFCTSKAPCSELMEPVRPASCTYSALSSVGIAARIRRFASRRLPQSTARFYIDRDARGRKRFSRTVRLLNIHSTCLT